MKFKFFLLCFIILSDLSVFSQSANQVLEMMSNEKYTPNARDIGQQYAVDTCLLACGDI